MNNAISGLRIAVDNTIAGYDFVKGNGVDVLRSDFQNTIVNFCVSGLPGLEGLSAAKHAQLAARGIVASQDAQIIYIPESMKDFIAWLHKSYGTSIFDISKIHFYNGLTGYPHLGLEGRGYGASLDYYTENALDDLELRNRMRTFEYFNHKGRTLRWLQNNNFGELVQEETEQIVGLDALMARCGDLDFSKGQVYFIKSSIGASGAGTWKISSQLDLQLMVNELHSNGYGKIRERIGEDGNLLNSLLFDKKTNSWVNHHQVQNCFIIQAKYQPKISEDGEVSFGEYSANFFINNSGGYIVTESVNLVDEKGEHKGNVKHYLPEWVRQKLDSVISKMYEQGFRGNIGFDFFIDAIAERVIVLECNPRNTGATNPEIVRDVIDATKWKYGQLFDGKYQAVGTGDYIPITPHIVQNGVLSSPQGVQLSS